MKIDETIVQAVSSEEFKSIAFRVDQKMAQVIFRDKLYTAEGRLRVIAQEYMANARDAHRAAGKSDTPIEVTLPTNMQREFIVRDYGNGIPPNIIEDVFVVYGASTKNGSNIENGGYGIGAKCAFSYVNAFSVTTTVQGVRYIYAASIDSAGMNQFVLMDTGPATGPDGTEIRVPIKSVDILMLRQWIREITHSWNPRPSFGTETLDYFDHKPYETGDRWELYSRVSPYAYRTFTSGITVTADDIPYVLTREQVSAIGPNVEVMYDLLREKAQCLVIHFKNGELTIPPQRESVDMTPRSKSAISAAIDRTVSFLVKKAEDEFEAAVTPLQRVSLALRDDFYLMVARKASGVIKSDIAAYGKTFDAENAGIRIYEGRYNSRLFREFEEQETTSLTQLAAPKGANTFVVDTKGKKMQAADLKRLMRGHRDLSYGDVFVVAVYDEAAFRKEVGVDIPTLVQAGAYSFCERDVSAMPKMRTAGGYFFLKGFKLSYSSHSGMHYSESNKTKVSIMPSNGVYIDMEDGNPLYEGKVITQDRLCEFAHLHHVLKNHGDIGMSWVQCWEERFEEEYRPADYTFLEDALLEAIESALQLPHKRLVDMAFKTMSTYVESTQWPGINHTDRVVDLCVKLGYSDEFTSILRQVICLENGSCERSDTDRKYIQKIWGLIDADARVPLEAALNAAVKKLYDVRDEFIKLAYSAPMTPVFVNLLSTGHCINVRHNGDNVPVDWTEMLTASLKTHPIPPAYKATP